MTGKLYRTELLCGWVASMVHYSPSATVFTSGEGSALSFIDRLEGTLSIVEEGVRLLQGTTYVAEHCCVWNAQRTVAAHLPNYT